MLVKKFEAETMEEVLKVVKKELGPEAVILKTRKNKRGFGLLSKSSVEVTAAVSSRSIQQKKSVDRKLPQDKAKLIESMSAKDQAGVYNKYLENRVNAASKTQDRVELGRSASTTPAKYAKYHRVTSRSYADIRDEDEREISKVTVPISTPKAKNQSDDTALKNELESLKKMIQDLQTKEKENSPQNKEFKNWEEGKEYAGQDRAIKISTLESNPLFMEVFDQLTLNGVDRKLAAELMKQVEFSLADKKTDDLELLLDQAAEEMMKNTELVSPLREDSKSHPQFLALVGPTGVGKTTTIAKIASEAKLKRNLKTALISVDCYKVSALDHLKEYAKILNIPYRTVQNRADLDLAVQDFKHFDLVLVDTTGRSQKDTESLREMKELLSSIPGLKSELVLSAVTRDIELYDMARRFLIFKPESLILSKLDEANVFGSIYNVSQKLKIPISYLTTGQKVPEDIEPAQKERLVALVMDL